MTTTALPKFDAQTADNRHISAELLYHFLKIVSPDLAVIYDGDRTVTVGRIEVRYLDRAAEISFPDPHTGDGRAVVAYVPGKHTFGAVSAIVGGLLTDRRVTP
jgi:hypothetical protein